MPELPEVETVRRSLEGPLTGRQIINLQLRDFPGVVGPLGVERVAEMIVGRTITAVRRRAKYLLLILDGDEVLMIHLRMTGRVEVVPAGADRLRFEHLAIGLDNGYEIRFADQRKFGRVTPMNGAALAGLDIRLGPEPLSPDFTAGWLAARLSRRPGKIKSVLLDQAVVAGLGNIYADEALFRARINPDRSARDLNAGEITRLHRALRLVLREGLANRGTTFSSFQDASGREGANQHNLRVYGRGGKSPCVRCGAPLVRTVTGGRGTSFCPRCQPLVPPGSTVETPVTS